MAMNDGVIPPTPWELKIARAHNENFFRAALPEFKGVWEQASPFTMLSRERVYHVYKAVLYCLQNKICGDFVQVGVWAGGGLVAIAKSLELYFGSSMIPEFGSRTLIWGFDTFEGHGRPGEHEIDIWGTSQAVVYDELMDGGWASVSKEEVQKNLLTCLGSLNGINLVKGRCEATLPDLAPDKVSVLIIDVDWFESTYSSLTHLWPRLAVGGILICDDYGHHSGARDAIDQYFTEIGEAPFFTHIDYSCISAVKSK